MPTLSVLIITKNEEKNIRECLNSVKDIADEIIVYDAGSTDATIDIAKELNARTFIDTAWDGYGKQRQKAQTKAVGDFCFWIDADERVDNSLKKEIKNFMQHGSPNYMLKIQRNNWAFGVRVKHSGWSPDRVIRLYSRSHTTYNNHRVHESVIVKRNSVIMNATCCITHYPCTNFCIFMQKQLCYSDLWARQQYIQNNNSCSWIRPIISSCWAFFIKYFLRKGFLDGKNGLIICSIIALYTFNKYLELYLLSVRNSKEKKNK